MLTFSCAVICSLAAAFGGFLDAISGGGGLLTLPALLLTGVPPHIALGTNKVSACFGTTVSLINYSLHKLVNWRIAAYGIAFSLFGSWVGTLLALYLEPEILGKVLVILLPFAMIATLIPPKKRKVEDEPIIGKRFWILLPLVSLCMGAYDGFFGPATGSFWILALYWLMKMDLIASSATAKAFNLASNVSAAVSFVWHGAILWPLALLMGACFMAGNWLGSAVAIKIGAGIVRRLLVVSLLFLLTSLVWQYFIS